MAENSKKHVFNTYLWNLLFYTLICSMGQQVVFKVPTIFMIPYHDYPRGHHSHSFVSKNGWKWLKNMLLTMLNSITSYSMHKYVLRANEWCSIFLWYQHRCMLNSWPHNYSYPMGYQSHSFVSKNGRKQIFDDTYLRNLLYYRQSSSLGHRLVFNYPRVSFRVPTTLMTPYSYRMGHHNVDKCKCR
jgi:hypothetical protein